jgi:transketolase
MSIEDLALACSLPGFTVISPADEIAARAAVRWAANNYGGVFIRTGRAKVPIIYNDESQIVIGQANELLPGTDVTLVAHGMMVAESIRAAEALDADGISARVLDLHTVKPLDEAALAQAARETGAIVVAEEHLVDGGLGVRVAQAVTRSVPVPMEFIGLTTYAESGTPAGVPVKYGLTPGAIVEAARKVIARKK